MHGNRSVLGQSDVFEILMERTFTCDSRLTSLLAVNLGLHVTCEETYRDKPQNLMIPIIIFVIA